MDMNSILAGGGMTSLLISVLFACYKLASLRKSHCRGEIGGVAIEIGQPVAGAAAEEGVSVASRTRSKTTQNPLSKK